MIDWMWQVWGSKGAGNRNKANVSVPVMNSRMADDDFCIDKKHWRSSCMFRWRDVLESQKVGDDKFIFSVPYRSFKLHSNKQRCAGRTWYLHDIFKCPILLNYIAGVVSLPQISANQSKVIE